MRMLLTELRAAARALARSPLFATVAILSLGLALALNTTMFGIVDAILHPPVPYPTPKGLYLAVFRGDDPRRYVESAEKERAVRAGLTVADGIAATSMSPAQVVVGDEGSDGLVTVVSPDYFRVVGVPALHGRTLGSGSEAVISFALWRRALGGRPLTERLTIELNEQPFTVVGVMPPGMTLGGTAIWVPAGGLPRDTSRFGRAIQLVIRLRPEATRAQLEAELALVARRLQIAHGSPNYPLAAMVRGVEKASPRVDGFQRFLLAVVAGVLAIACANLATLLFSRGAAQRREMAVRLAIGASRSRIALQVLLECGIIAVGAAAVGLVLARWAMQLMAHWAPPYVPQLGEFVPNASWRVFAFALGVAVLVILVAGVLPALRAAAVPPAEPLKDGAGTTRRRDRYSTLVVAEVAMSTALLMLAALLTLGNWRLARHEFGFDARRVTVASVNFGWKRERAMRPAEAVSMRQDILTRLRSLPGVRDAAAVRSWSPRGPVVLGENGPAGERWINLRSYDVVSPSYLRTLGIPVVAGRDFSDGDASGGEPVAIVDRDAARRLWPEYASPVGRMLKLGEAQSDAPWVRVIGVAQPLGRSPNDPSYLADDPEIYVVQPGDSTPPGNFLIAASKEDPAMGLAIRRELHRVVGGATWLQVEPYTAMFDQNLRYVGFLALLLCALSVFALVLCAVGLYGVLAVTVSQRSREFAIRVALGAPSPAIARLVVSDAAVMALGGVAIGAFIALGATFGWAADMLDIRLAHAKALIAAELVLLVVAALAAWEPVRRGTRADPATMLPAS